MSKIVLITGARGGLGQAVVATTRAQGNIPVAVGRDPEGLKKTFDNEITKIAADVSTPGGAETAVATCIEAMGLPDALVNCAGQVFLGSMARTSESQYRACMAANADTAFFSLQAFVRALSEAGKGGSAVLVSTVAARIGIQNHEAVAAAKGAVEGLVRAAAATYASSGIRVNGVAPGLTETPATEYLLRTDRNRDLMAKQYPVGRYGKPADVAGAIQWLLSDEAEWMTGQILGMDGGFTGIRPLVA